jgi:hypothetical protein
VNLEIEEEVKKKELQGLRRIMQHTLEQEA